jgi:hypothetical protein
MRLLRDLGRLIGREVNVDEVVVRGLSLFEVVSGSEVWCFGLGVLGGQPGVDDGGGLFGRGDVCA